MNIETDYDFFTLAIILIIVILVAITFIAINFAVQWNEEVEQQAKPVREWIGETSNCNDLINYMIGKEGMEQVEQYYNKNGKTYKMADEKFKMLVETGDCQ